MVVQVNLILQSMKDYLSLLKYILSIFYMNKQRYLFCYCASIFAIVFENLCQCPSTV